MMRDAERIVLGRVVGIYGVNGWIKLVSYTRPRENILNYDQWWLGLDGEWRQYARTGGRSQGKGLIAALSGITDRDDARELIGAEIAIERSALPAPARGEFYWCDLIGLRVLLPTGEELGRVSTLQETGANDILVVGRPDGKQELIPYVPGHYVLDINLDTGTMTVDWQPEE